MRRQLVPGPVVRLTVIKAKTRPGIEATKIADYNGFKVRLGLSDAEINAIDLTISDIPGRFYAALKKWKSKGMFDSTATYGRLVEIARILEDGEAFQSIKRACIEHTSKLYCTYKSLSSHSNIK